MTELDIKQKYAHLFLLIPDKYCTWEMYLIVKKEEQKEIDSLK